MTTTTEKGLDTLKVLAKRIAPGQEYLDDKFEAFGKRMWYGDYGTGKTDNVFVVGPLSAINKLLKTVIKPHAYGAIYVWGFDSRSEADRFVHALYPSPVSYWQVGLSRGFAVSSEVPLYGFFREDKPGIRTPSEEMGRTERVRAHAQGLFSEFGRRVGVSALYVNKIVLQSEKLPFSGKDCGTFNLDDEEFYYRVFKDPIEAKFSFGRAAQCAIGEGWHFGLNPNF